MTTQESTAIVTGAASGIGFATALRLAKAGHRVMAARQLDNRMGTPDEVAAGIAFLASDDGRFVNGSAFMMDGGVTAV